ncbi:MAG: hypothetical protein ACJA0Q_000475 [Saprospiraceae bacterium]|jgi:hypothetical protein
MGALPIFHKELISSFDGYTYGTDKKYDKVVEFTHQDSLSSPLGGKYLRIQGNDTEEGLEWCFGGYDIHYAATSFDGLSTSNAYSLYIKFFIRTQGDANSAVGVTVTRVRDSYSYVHGTTSTDWEYVTIKMSDLVLRNSSNKLHSSMALDKGIALSLVTDKEPASIGEIHLDFLMITVGEPFLPLERS